MRNGIVVCLVAILVGACASQAAAQAPAALEESGARMQSDGGLLIDRIDPERLRLIRTERMRQYMLGAGLLAAGGLVGFSKQNWELDEGVVGYAIAVLGVAAFVEPLTWRDLEVSTSASGLSLAW